MQTLRKHFENLRTRRRCAPFIAFLLFSLSFVCGGSPRPQAETLANTPIDITDTDDGFEAAFVEAAKNIAARARNAEPTVTAQVRAIAIRYNAKLAGLEFRLKTEHSILRKLHLRAIHGLGPEGVVIDDSLRYTISIDDADQESYTKNVAAMLRNLEQEGHKVTLVKNYWPKGDSYSGINTILQTAAGLMWELQFHTSASYKLKTIQWMQYEELRSFDTEIPRKRVLFDDMTQNWEDVPIPAHVLEPHSVHPAERIIERLRP